LVLVGQAARDLLAVRSRPGRGLGPRSSRLGWLLVEGLVGRVPVVVLLVGVQERW
jgi:hypothetical protein